MKPSERSLSYLENAITVAAFGTEEARDAFVASASGEDLVEIALRHAPIDLREDYIRAAEPLSTCGIPTVEGRAKQIIAFATQPPPARDVRSAPGQDSLRQRLWQRFRKA
jgi:hypothetical protein